MDLDLNWLTHIRSSLGVAPGPLDYVLDTIRNEQLLRMDERLENSSGALLIDFLNTNNAYRSKFEATHSILEHGFELAESRQFDLIVINFQLAWLDFEAILVLVREWLVPGGELFFVTFGPDTFHQIKDAWSVSDELIHVHDFTDMHHIGDQLVRLGFERPIMDVDWMAMEFQTETELIQELKKEGFMNLSTNRRKTLTGKDRFGKFLLNFREICRQQNSAALTLEVIYGYARKSEKGSDGSARIEVQPPVW